MNTLQVLLSIYSALLLINTVFSIQLWLTYRDRVYWLLIGVWAFTLINFVLQSLSLHSVMGSIIGFSSYIFAAYCLCRILARISAIPFSFNTYWMLYAIGITLSITLQLMDYAFALAALPVAIALAAPQISFALKKLLKHRQSGIALSNTFALILLLNGLHFLDYPFLRPNLDFAVFGYAIVIAFSMVLAILLPCITGSYHYNKLNTQLVEEVEHRKRTEQQLADALTEAETVTEIKSRFLVNMSHEIRTPLNGVIGLNDLMKHTPLNEKQRRYCDGIDASSDHLLTILNNVLSLAKLESGATPINNEVFSPHNLAKEIIAYYQQHQESCSIHYEVIEPMPETLISDKGKLCQIVYNLINNAIKYSGGDFIGFSMRYEAHNATEGCLYLAIEDNGIGIAADKLAEAFHPFEQYNHTAQGSVGLGLSITKELLTLLGGSIHIESEVQKGTQAVCKLPVVSHKAALAEHQAVDPGKVDHGDNIIAFSPTVLVVEDNTTNQWVMEEMLNQEKVNFVLAKDGKEAMAYYHRHKPDLIFMDIQLPDTNGVELTQHIRINDKQTPIIVLSAFAFEEDKANGIKAGANDYVRKPAKQQEIKSILDKYLNLDVA